MSHRTLFLGSSIPRKRVRFETAVQSEKLGVSRTATNIVRDYLGGSPLVVRAERFCAGKTLLPALLHVFFFVPRGTAVCAASKARDVRHVRRNRLAVREFARVVPASRNYKRESRNLVTHPPSVHLAAARSLSLVGCGVVVQHPPPQKVRYWQATPRCMRENSNDCGGGHGAVAWGTEAQTPLDPADIKL